MWQLVYNYLQPKLQAIPNLPHALKPVPAVQNPNRFIWANYDTEALWSEYLGKLPHALRFTERNVH
jgi:hypothetical protein